MAARGAAVSGSCKAWSGDPAGRRRRRAVPQRQSIACQQGQHIGPEEAGLIVAVMTAVMAAPADGRIPPMLPQPGVQLGVPGAFHDRPEAIAARRRTILT